MEKCKQNESEARGMATTGKEIADAYSYPAYIGLDVHKETISVSVAAAGGGGAEHRGEIANRPEAVQLQLKKLNQAFGGERLLFCYEAGPCGYPLYRQLKSSGHHVQVVAPSLIPKRAGVRIKTDRRDADKLASLLRSGELTPVWVPDEETEAMRDLVCARDDLKAIEKKTRQQLNAMVLRHGHAWPATRTRWTKTYYNWLETLKFEHDWNYVVIQEYIEASQESTRRVDNITEQILRLVPQWSLAAVVHSLVALRGVDYLSAIQLLAELGDLSRFDSPKELMAFVGLVPSIHASGDRSRSGAITKTGNRHVRRSLVECAWSYRFPARRTAHLRRKASQASDYAISVSWKAQKRLCNRHRTMLLNGKNSKQVNVAIARELLGFLWDIACYEMKRINPKAA